MHNVRRGVRDERNRGDRQKVRERKARLFSGHLIVDALRALLATITRPPARDRYWVGGLLGGLDVEDVIPLGTGPSGVVFS
jgi:hypothetical protein